MTFQGIPYVLNGEEVQLQPIVPLSPIYEEGYPCVPSAVRVRPIPTKECGKRGAKWFIWKYESDLSDGCLDSWIDGCKDRLLEPYSEATLDVLAQLLYELEMCRLQRKKPRAAKSTEWETANLVAEVEAVCGEGKRVGRHWVFRCPFPKHGRGDRHPSLHVEPLKRTWLCRSCGTGGGVTDWRKLTNQH